MDYRTIRLTAICCVLLIASTVMCIVSIPVKSAGAQIDPTIAAIDADKLRRQGELAATASVVHQATAEAQATVFALNIQATQDARMVTLTAVAREDEIRVAQATAQAQATATSNANATATAQAHATATANANATMTAQAQAMETANANATETAQAQATATANAVVESTQVAAQATRSYVAFQESTRRQHENLKIGAGVAVLVGVFLLLLIGFRMYQMMKPSAKAVDTVATATAEGQGAGQDEEKPAVPEADKIDVQLNDAATLNVWTVLQSEGIQPQSEV